MKLIYILFLLTIYQIKLLPQTSSLDAKLQSIRTQYNVVGMSVAVVKGDSLVFSKGYGFRDLSRNLPVNDSTVYRIASISKMITATALMILYEQGLFNLDDDVSNYLGFTLRNPNFPNDKITFRKLLSHTSSLRDGSGYSSFLTATYNDNPPPTLQSLLTTGGSYYTADMFDASKSPSSNYFQYANINFGVIGTLVERLSNKRFDVFCKEKIFDRLRIAGSFNIQDIPNINNVAVLYRRSGGSWVPQFDNYNGIKPPPRDLSNYVIGTNGIVFAPQGGLRISANDLAKFMLMIMNGGILNGVRILNDTTINKMLTPSWIYNGSNGNNYYGIFNTYGFGCSRTSDLLPGETLYGHPGEAYGLISDLYFSKIKDYGIIFITNGGQWGYGNYSGWYNIEEDVYKACKSFVDSLMLNVFVENQTPEKFSLFQNYPNPFNSKTKIKFSVKDFDFTS
ncbi:MAG: beta-lactamase family protein, partial [Ignavibacteria bacterium]|nr:beta-lactamase family protein [Ignavibacteria bacterium]